MSVEVPDPSATVESDRRAWLDAVAEVESPSALKSTSRKLPVCRVDGFRRPAVTPSRPSCTPRWRARCGLVGDPPVVASRLALAADSDVVLVDYRLLPEHGIADSIQDVMTVHRSLMGRYEQAPQCVVFAGDSSGATLALAARIALRENGDP